MMIIQSFVGKVISGGVDGRSSKHPRNRNNGKRKDKKQRKKKKKRRRKGRPSMDGPTGK